MPLTTVPAAALQHRRNRLLAALGKQPALLAAGSPRPRNYAANTYPFRAHSHFLYFFGWGAPGAFGLFDAGVATLFLPVPGPDDALWSGPSPSFAEIAESLGVAVLPVDVLPSRFRGRVIATLPAPDAETRANQAALLGRELRAGVLAEPDRTLAEHVIALRLQHDEAAVAELRHAVEITAVAHRAGMHVTAPGMTESEVRAAMEAEIVARNCATAYPSIVTVQGEILHNESHRRRLASGDLVLADVGAESPAGFAADVTRTWPVAGRYDQAAADFYDVVLSAQRAAIDAVRPGVGYRDIHVLATETLARGLFGLGILRGDPAERAHDGSAALFFPHGIGHLLGLDVHDMEDLGDRAGYGPGRTRSRLPGLRYLRLDRELLPGMAVTIEPGIYFVPALLDPPETRRAFASRVDFAAVDRVRRLRGIRIEDDVLVTASGHEVLTSAIPKTRAAITSEMAARSRPQFD